MIDLFLGKPEYANTIQTVCPHILRYLTAAVITTEKKRNALKDLIKVREIGVKWVCGGCVKWMCE